MAVTYPQRDPTSVVGRRVLAFLIDTIIGWALSAGLFFAMAETSDEPLTFVNTIYAQVTLGDTTYFVEGADVFYLWLVGIGWAVLAHVILTGITGASPGKAIVGIRVVNENSERPGLGRAFVRWIVLIVDAIPYFIPMLVGFILALSSNGHRRLGDMAAKTFVVRRDAVGQPIAAGAGAAAAPPPSGWGQPAPVQQAAAAAPAGNQPRWDTDRNAWITWDASQNQWLQHDADSGEWRPIS